MTISVRKAGRFSFFFNVDQISRGNGKIRRRWEIYVRQDIYVSGYREVVVGYFCCCCFYLFILHLLPSWKYFIAYTQRVTLDNVHTLYIYAMKIVFCSLFIAVISPIFSFWYLMAILLLLLPFSHSLLAAAWIQSSVLYFYFMFLFSLRECI